MWAALQTFILALPRLIQLCENVLNGFQEIIQTQKENALAQKEILGIQKALLSKDSSDLEKVYREGGT